MAVAPARVQTPSRAIPLADLAELRRAVLRTSVLRLALAALLLVLVAGAALAARSEPASTGTSLVPGGDSGVIVLDLSASIGSTPHISAARAFRYIARTKQPFGLVIFSDTAYEAMPPGTPASEMKPLLRYFGRIVLQPCFAPPGTPCPPGTKRTEPNDFQDAVDRLRRTPASPWSESFRAGTRISLGLDQAADVLRRERMRGGVLLISDLDDSLFDVPLLTRSLIRYEKRSIPMRVVALSPGLDDRRYFERMLGREAFVTRPELSPRRSAIAGAGARRDGGEFPWTLALLAAGVLVLLAGNEHLCGRLTWRRGREEAA